MADPTDMDANDPPQEPKLPWRPKSVAVFGGGIAGLTAAHELIERGYEVDVYEQAEPAFNENDCGIGGMARTQWAWALTARTLLYDDSKPATPRWRAKGTRRLDETREMVEARRALKARIQFRVNDATLSTKARRQIARIATRINAAIAADPPWRELRIHVRGYTHTDLPPLCVDQRTTRKPGEEPRYDNERAYAVLEELKKCGVSDDFLETSALGLGYPDDWRRTDRERCHVEFFVFEDKIPGEHGFRFFPAFYRHLRNTMRRTPIPERSEPYVETPRTVHDNLIPTTLQRFSPEGGPAFEMPRRSVRSLHELFELIARLFESTKYPRKDVERLKLMIFKYMTSSPERRRDEYEDMSWWDFVGGESFEQTMRKHLDSMPQLLVAMTGRDSDARSFGNVTTQLVKDQFQGTPDTDGLLNGPTSEAWFQHWRRYLEIQGVRFHRGRLERFLQWKDRLWPVITLWVNGVQDPIPRVVVRDFHVVALSAEAIQNILLRQPASKATTSTRSVSSS
jgi:hypothetical protein